VSAHIAMLDGLLGPRTEGVGSNSWVIGGSRTTTGTPILANDPHLGIQMPSIWYEIGGHCRTLSAACPYDFYGVSFAGTPGIVIGHNNRIAWGLTFLAYDVQDLYIEKINPANANQYEVSQPDDQSQGQDQTGSRKPGKGFGGVRPGDGHDRSVPACPLHPPRPDHQRRA